MESLFEKNNAAGCCLLPSFQIKPSLGNNKSYIIHGKRGQVIFCMDNRHGVALSNHKLCFL